MKHSKLFRIGICIFAILLTSSCNTSETRPQPSVEPYVPPVTDVSPTNTPLPPLPDFPSDILFFGYGGGSLDLYCAIFPTLPAITGRTTYPIAPTEFRSYTGVGPDFDYPRHAELCLDGAPQDTRIELKLISPSQAVTLRTAFIIDSKSKPGELLVSWVEYPADWANDTGNIFIDSFAGLSHDSNGNPTGSTFVSLQIWWAGALESGTWKIEASWPGQTVTGDFAANTHRLHEVSLGDPDFNSRIIPVINSADPYTCRPAMYVQPFYAVVEGFAPNVPVYILVYDATPAASWGYQTALVYKTALYADAQGAGRVDLATTFQPGTMYLMFATADPAVQLTVNTDNENSVFNYAAIANAMDCFIIPSQTISSCPGAPPQRMVVNQRGSVCTKSEPVRMRTLPARSADTLIEVSSGTQFTVIGGPSCSDDWSWWNVRLEDGTTGWLAEGGDEVDPYFICPLQ